MYTWGDDPINIHERTFIYSLAYAKTEYRSGTCRKLNVLIQVLIVL